MASFRRLAIVTSEFLPFAGGMATYTAAIANIVASWNVDLTVIAPQYGEPPLQLPYSVLRILRHHRLSPVCFARLYGFLLRQPRDTFLHGVDIRSALVLYAIHILTGRQYGLTIHGSEVQKLRHNHIGARAAKAAYRHAAFIFANSKATADIFSAHVDTTHPPLVTHLGVSPHWAEPPPSSLTNGEMGAFLAARPCICTVGRLEGRKGHKRVLESLARLKAEGSSDVGYVVAGPAIDDFYRKEVVAMAESLAIPVLFTGVLSEPDLKRLYALSVCHVLAAVSLPDRIEGFGLVLLEAATQSCPSVATRVGGIPEVVVHGETGLLVDDKDSAGLAAALRNMLTDQSLRNRLGKNAREHAEKFTWETCARTTYRNILCVSGV